MEKTFALKIVHVTPSYHPWVGGVEFHVKQLSENLAKEGTDVEVYTTDFPRVTQRKETLNNVKVTRVFSFAPNNSYFLPVRLLGLLQKVKADVVHAHDIHSLPIVYAAFAKNSNHIPLVSTFYFHGRAHTPFRNLLFQPYKRLFGEYVLEKTDLLICLSEYERKIIQENFVTHVGMETIPAGLRFDPSVGCIQKKGSERKITFVGRLEAYKGVQHLLRAFSKLAKEIHAGLTIVGEGPFKPKLERMAIELGVSDKVTFSSKKGDDVVSEYYTSDVVVIPSSKESFNLVAIEALACGVPVITTPIGEGYELAKEGNCLPLSNPADTHELCEKIVTALDEKYFKRINSNRKKIIDRYSYRKIADLTLKAYERARASF